MNRLRGIVTIFVTATCGLGWAVAVPATAAAETVPPTITITSPTENQFYALNAPITPAFSCDDPGGSGVASCVRTGPAASTATPGAHTFTVFAVDNDGNTATKVVNYFVDATAPTITIAAPTDGQHFELGATISASFSCADPGGSGVATCVAATPLNTAVGTHTYTVNATDNVGNPASKSITYTVDPDTTNPTITINSPTDGQHFALGATITADYDCDDTGGSGLATCVAATPINTTVGSHIYTVNASDNAGNTATKSITYIVDPDTTNPTITITEPTDGKHYVFGAAIVADFDCDDAGGSGLATCVAATPINTAVGTHVYTVNASDNAGNTATKSVTYSVDDVTPPTITITVPTEGQHFAFGAAINASFELLRPRWLGHRHVHGGEHRRLQRRHARVHRQCQGLRRQHGQQDGQLHGRSRHDPADDHDHLARRRPALRVRHDVPRRLQLRRHRRLGRGDLRRVDRHRPQRRHARVHGQRDGRPWQRDDEVRDLHRRRAARRWRWR